VTANPEDHLPEMMVPVIVPKEMEEPEVSDDEAKEALKSIGAMTTVGAIRAMQTVGTWSVKIQAPKIALARSFKSLEEVDLCKKHARALMEGASGQSELDTVSDPELMASGIKMMCLEQQEGAILKTMMKAQAQVDVPKEKRGGRNAPPALHLHQHITKA